MRAAPYEFCGGANAWRAFAIDRSSRDLVVTASAGPLSNCRSNIFTACRNVRDAFIWTANNMLMRLRGICCKVVACLLTRSGLSKAAASVLHY